jgi:DHA2 family multidrug resistance protein
VTARAGQPLPPLDKRRLVTFVFMVFGMFMAILDIQIVSASLAEIQAGLSASADEISWVQTSYLIAEVIAIPLSGMLARVLSTRWMFAISAGGFTLMSVACAFATSIGEMVVFRSLQGFLGGGMIPTVFASAYAIFRGRQALISPAIGLVATLAPTVGPTIGGYLTDLFSWHWLFLINLGPGIVVTLAAWLLIDFDEPELDLLSRFDWSGLLFMAVMLGCTQYVLEEGPGDGWLEDDTVAALSLVGAVAAVGFFWRAFAAAQPIVELRAFADRNFAAGCAFSLVMGVGLYGLTYLYPLYLARVRGYSALQIGETMFVTGLCMFLMAPVAGRLMRVLDPRAMLGLGFLGFAAGTWLVGGLTKDWGFWELLLPQVCRGVSLMLCMVSVNNIALGTLSPDRLKNASALYNLTRNLGGAIGLAVINTVLDDRMDLHLQRLHEKVTWTSAAALERLAELTARVQGLGSDAGDAALKLLARTARTEALVMAFADVFVALGVLFLVMACATPLIRRPTLAGSAGH